MKPYERARAMIKATMTIIKENYEVEFQVHDLCETLKQALEIMDNITEHEKNREDGQKAIDEARKIVEEMEADFVPRPFDASFGLED